jgi:site-specific DNA-methyltransferase (adenine-specific)
MIVLGPGDLPARLVLDDDLLVCAENTTALAALPDGAFELIYIDPPFNTGADRTRRTLEVVRDETGTPGFGGHGYARREVGRRTYADAFEDYVGFLSPRLARARELLSPAGTLYVHLDCREAHYVKVELDRIFGRECFLNEIIWAYDYGAKTKRRWPSKHDTILVYVRDPRAYWFDSEAVDREPYMAPGLVGAAKAARGKLPTSVWWHTIVATNGREKTGYPTQKPEGVVRRIVAASSRPGSWCLDFFAGSGTLGAVARALDRRFVLVDCNPEAIAVARARLEAPARGSPRC